MRWGFLPVFYCIAMLSTAWHLCTLSGEIFNVQAGNGTEEIRAFLTQQRPEMKLDKAGVVFDKDYDQHISRYALIVLTLLPIAWAVPALLSKTR